MRAYRAIFDNDLATLRFLFEVEQRGTDLSGRSQPEQHGGVHTVEEGNDKRDREEEKQDVCSA